MAKKLSVIDEKQAQLDFVRTRTQGVISVVTQTINSLTDINAVIDDEIGDIDGYQRSLSETREGLVAAQQQNATIIANFRALIGAN